MNHSRRHYWRLASVILLASSLSCQARIVSSTGQTELANAATLQEIMEQNRQTFPQTREVDAATVAQWINDDGVVLIDVRTAEERQVSILPGAISATEFERMIGSFVDKHKVSYCTIGYRSAEYAQTMSRRGVAIASFNGGIVAWCQAGNLLSTSGGQETKRVHTYGRKWSLVSSDYEAVW